MQPQVLVESLSWGGSHGGSCLISCHMGKGQRVMLSPGKGEGSDNCSYPLPLPPFCSVWDSSLWHGATPT